MRHLYICNAWAGLEFMTLARITNVNTFAGRHTSTRETQF